MGGNDDILCLNGIDASTGGYLVPPLSLDQAAAIVRGALAVIGHVERAWGCSIVTPKAGAQLLPFRNALERLALGQPAGHAMKDFNERYATLSTTLAGMLEEMEFGAAVDSEELVRAWVERNDAEGYLVIGDPGRGDQGRPADWLISDDFE